MSDIPGPSESQVVNACIRWCFAHGIDCWRQNTGGFTKTYFRKRDQKHITKTVRFGRKGAADIHGIIPITINGQTFGRHLSIECKSADGEQRIEQIAEQQRVEAKGGLYVLARSIDELEAAKDLILGRGA